MNPYYEHFKNALSQSSAKENSLSNPYYDRFKTISGSGFKTDKDVGNIYAGTLHQMGYGYRDFDSMRGEGWLSDIFNNVAKPLLIQGAKYLGLKGVDMVSNIASDAIKGKDLKEAVNDRFVETKDAVVQEVPKTVFGLFKKGNKDATHKRKAISRPSAGALVTSASKRRKVTGRGFAGGNLTKPHKTVKREIATEIFPVLKFI